MTGLLVKLGILYDMDDMRVWKNQSFDMKLRLISYESFNFSACNVLVAGGRFDFLKAQHGSMIPSHHKISLE